MIGFDDSMPIGAMTIGDLKVLMQEILETAAGQTTNKRNTAAPNATKTTVSATSNK